MKEVVARNRWLWRLREDGNIHNGKSPSFLTLSRKKAYKINSSGRYPAQGGPLKPTFNLVHKTPIAALIHPETSQETEKAV